MVNLLRRPCSLIVVALLVVRCRPEGAPLRLLSPSVTIACGEILVVRAGGTPFDFAQDKPAVRGLPELAWFYSCVAGLIF